MPRQEVVVMTSPNIVLVKVPHGALPCLPAEALT